MMDSLPITLFPSGDLTRVRSLDERGNVQECSKYGVTKMGRPYTYLSLHVGRWMQLLEFLADFMSAEFGYAP